MTAPKPPLRLTAADRTTARFVDPQQASAGLPGRYMARRGARFLASTIRQPCAPGPHSRQK